MKQKGRENSGGRVRRAGKSILTRVAAVVMSAVIMAGATLTGAALNLLTITAAAEVFVSGDYSCKVLDDGTVSITGYNGEGGDVAISDTIAGKKVTSIGFGAFRYCTSLKSVTIPDSVTSIGPAAFHYCSCLLSIVISDTVESIGAGAFYGCSGLKSITIPNSVSEIGASAFSYCSSLTAVRIPSGLTIIDASTFYDCSSLTSIMIPDGVTSIGDSAFYGCSNLTSMTIPDRVTNIGNSAFYGCSGLTMMQIPNSVTNIGEWAFAKCKSLISIVLGSGLQKIGRLAFYECINLSLVNVDSSSDYLCFENNTFFNKNKTRLFQHLSDSKDANYQIPSSVKVIDKYAFALCSNLTSIEIPDSVEFVDEYAFTLCSNLTSIKMPNKVTSIQRGTFEDCSELTTIYIPKSVTSIVDYAFSWCPELENVYYSGTKAEWEKISIGDNNDELTNATIHFKDDEQGDDNQGDVEQATSNVRFLSSYDPETDKVRFDETSTSIEPDYTLSDDIDKTAVSSMLNKYVLAETDANTNVVTDLTLVESKIGTITAIDEKNSTISIDDVVYPIMSERFASTVFSGQNIGLTVLAHMENNVIISLELLYDQIGKFENWDPISMNLTIDGNIFPTNYMSVLTGVEKLVGKKVHYLSPKNFNYNPVFKVMDADIENNFNADIYHANWLLSNESYDDALQNYTYSVDLVEETHKNGTDDMMSCWRAITKAFASLGDLPETSLKLTYNVEQKDVYMSIILDALKSSSDINIIPEKFEENYKVANDIFSSINDYVKLKYQIDLNADKSKFKDFSLSEDDKTELKEKIKEEHPKLSSIESTFKFVTGVIDIVDNVEDYANYVANCFTLINVSEETETVLQLAYDKSLQMYGKDDALTYALNQCLTMISRNKDQLIDNITYGFIKSLGKCSLEYALDEFIWSPLTESIEQVFPAVKIIRLAAKYSTKLSNYISNSDKVSSKYIEMNSVIVVESLFNNVYYDAKRKFANAQSEENAAIYLAAFNLCYNLRDVDCDISEGYAKALRDGDLESRIKFAKDNYKHLHSMATLGWIYSLKNDHPAVYNKYYNLIIKPLETQLFFKKEIKAQCPINIYVYDKANNVVAYIENGNISCSADDIMVAVNGEEKTIRFYGEENYRVEYIAYDSGNMDITVNELDDNGSLARTVNYNDVILIDKQAYSLDVDNQTMKPYELLDKANNSIRNYDYDSMQENKAHTIKVISGFIERNNFTDIEIVASKGERLTLKAFIPDGYTFVKWICTSENVKIDDILSANTKMIMPDENVTITAMVNAPANLNKYKIEFDSNDGMGKFIELSTTESGKLMYLPTATRTGYTFDGWFTAAENGEKITADTVFTEDTTVYAHWTKNTESSDTPTIDQLPDDPDTSDETDTFDKTESSDAESGNDDSIVSSTPSEPASSGASSSISADPSSNSADMDSISSNSDETDYNRNPSTGAAVAMLPVIFAAGALVVIVNKKNKK